MYSEIECGICFRTYNTGWRCPRELDCKHSFCETCLLALSRPADEARLEADRSILCPLCRLTTIIPEERTIKTGLKVDESVLEQLIDAGVLDRDDEDDQWEEERRVPGSCDDHEEGTPPDTPAEEGDSSPGSRGGRIRRSWTKVWKKISGKNSPRNCRTMTNIDMRDFAMMASYMF
ncbi:RING finger protein 227 [Notolabrus celidotus]|uniref:RING finger protein 227 n=1 Tax=Notolabrus celidotus TaxID=1203425 RepID=UPI00148F99EC|nr:RING finger protein 227 [Notolabrus celidotus]